MKIVTMKCEHLPFVAELEEICFSSPWSLNALSEEIENPNAVFLVATENEKVVAYGGMHLIFGEGFVTNIAVFPSERKKGYAKAICHQLINRCSESISLEVRESNENAINLYKNLGFELVGKRKNFYDNPQENGLIYTIFKK